MAPKSKSKKATPAAARQAKPRKKIAPGRGPAKPARKTRAVTVKAKAKPARLAPLKPPAARVAGSDRNHRLNHTDIRLLELLQDDARMTNLALASAVDLSPAACHDRVRKLVDQGWLLGFNSQLNANALGAGLVVFASLRLNRADPKTLAAIAEMATMQPQVLECHRVSGDADVLLKIRCADLDAYRQLLDEVLLTTAGVTHVSSQIGLQTLKETSNIAIADLNA